MSVTLPIVEPSQDFVGQLLREQQTMSAVERFSALHDSGSERTAPAQEKYYRDLLPASPPSPDQQFAFQVDLDRCSGCKACVVACHTLNGLEDDESWRRVGTLTIGEQSTKTPPTIQHVTTACHHCEDPGCLNGCPVRAYEKDPVTGIVRHLDDQCIGCKYCTMMCPYEVPQYSDRLGIVRKCDMCHQRLSVGEAPACVQACPNEAIAITLVDRVAVISDRKRLAPGAPLSSITKPSTRYLSSRTAHVDGSMPQNTGIDEVAECHWPLAVMLVATQASVGVVVAECLLSTVWILGGHEASEVVTRWSALLALLVGAAGLNIASLHLGKPLRAWRVFLGLRTSWLSREAVVLGQYMGLLLLAVVMLWLPTIAQYFNDYIPKSIVAWIPGAEVATESVTRANKVNGMGMSYPAVFELLTKALLGMTIPFGMAGLLSSAMIYVATKRQLWRLGRTVLRFFGSTVILGFASVSAISAFTANGTSGGAMAIVAIVLLLAKLVWEWKILLGPDRNNSQSPPAGTNGKCQTIMEGQLYDRRSNRLVKKRLQGWANSRMITGAVGTFLLLLAATAAPVAPVFSGALAAVATLSIFGGELAERLIYFSSVVYDRMPGTL